MLLHHPPILFAAAPPPGWRLSLSKASQEISDGNGTSVMCREEIKWRTINNIYGVLQSRAWKYNSSKLRRRWPCAAGSGCRMTLSEDSHLLLPPVKNQLQQTTWWWSRDWKLVVWPKLDLHTVTNAGAPCFTYDTIKVQWSFFCILFFYRSTSIFFERSHKVLSTGGNASKETDSLRSVDQLWSSPLG